MTIVEILRADVDLTLTPAASLTARRRQPRKVRLLMCRWLLTAWIYSLGLIRAVRRTETYRYIAYMRWMAVGQVGLPLIDKIGLFLFWHGCGLAIVVGLTENPFVMKEAGPEMALPLFLLIAVPRSLIGPLVAYKTGRKTAEYLTAYRPKLFWQWRPKCTKAATERCEQWIARQVARITSEPVLLLLVICSEFISFWFVPVMSFLGARGAKHKWSLRFGVGSQKVMKAMMYKLGFSFSLTVLVVNIVH